MEIVDGDGFIFGVVNIIDALVILLVGTMVIAGVNLAFPPGGETQETRIIVLRTQPQPDYVVEAVSEGPVPTGEIVGVKSKNVVESSENGSKLRLEVQVNVTENSEGLASFKGKRLYVGRQLRLDFGKTILRGTVVDMRA